MRKRLHALLFCSSKPPGWKDLIHPVLNFILIREKQRAYDVADHGQNDNKQCLEKAEDHQKQRKDKRDPGTDLAGILVFEHIEEFDEQGSHSLTFHLCNYRLYAAYLNGNILNCNAGITFNIFLDSFLNFTHCRRNFYV